MITKEHFLKLSLSEEQSTIMAVLHDKGQLRASKVALYSGMERTLTYRTLEDLLTDGLITKTEKPNAVAIFSIAHPNSLKQILNTQENELLEAKSNLESVYSDLLTNFNLKSDKPTIQFFEGPSGVQTALNDSLTSKETIYTYVNLESVEKYFWDINSVYVEKRDKLGINKKMLVIGTAHAKKFFKDYHKDITDIRLLDSLPDRTTFDGTMQIYDGKISYITFSKDKEKMQSILITNQQLYEMHRYLFDVSYCSAQIVE